MIADPVDAVIIPPPTAFATACPAAMVPASAADDPAANACPKADTALPPDTPVEAKELPVPSAAPCNAAELAAPGNAAELAAPGNAAELAAPGNAAELAAPGAAAPAEPPATEEVREPTAPWPVNAPAAEPIAKG